ncbi:hypothetical protein F5Y08DRAFT_121497 [Xylaria arbuscula]|nr:hypothetical protein F5Y08DRAFT_121497 [Xylaria arbuscula]
MLQPQRSWRADGFGNTDVERGYSDGNEYENVGGGENGAYRYGNTATAGFNMREGVIGEFDTSRLDYEAVLAYVALPPLGAIILLILERGSDYVRFHAWQSSLLFTVIFILHLIFSFLSWVIVIADIASIAFLAMRAYHDADALDRYEIPIFGQIAKSHPRRRISRKDIGRNEERYLSNVVFLI